MNVVSQSRRADRCVRRRNLWIRLDDYDDLEVEWESGDLESATEFYEPPADYEDEDAIALDMEESIDDAIMFHGGNPFDWDTRSDFLDDPLGFGDDDDF